MKQRKILSCKLFRFQFFDRFPLIWHQDQSAICNDMIGQNCSTVSNTAWYDTIGWFSKQLAWPMTVRQIAHRKSRSVLSDKRGILIKTNFLGMVKMLHRKYVNQLKKNKMLHKVPVFNSASYDITCFTHTVLATEPG